MAELLAPDLEIRDEEQLAAEAIGRVSGGLTVEIIDSQMERLRRTRELVAGGALEGPLCPELTNANPSSPHTAFLEAMGWLLGQMGWRINQIPLRDEIEFHKLFGIELREAAPATAQLEFAVAPPEGVDVVVPLGTQVSTEDGSIRFETTADLEIPFGQAAGTVAARNVVAGVTLLAPDRLTRMIDPVAWVDSVTNPDGIDGGSDDEAVEEALARAVSYQRRAERLVSTVDCEEAILQDILLGQGIVRAFPFVAAGDFGGAARPGHTTVVVMTRTGNAIAELQKQGINSILEQRVGNQFIYISDPIYVEFNVTADVRLTSSAPQAVAAIKKAVETNLRTLYAADRANFGRPILRSEVIATIEGTTGVDRIVAPPAGSIIGSPAADVKLDPWQLPKLVTVTINVV